MTGSKTTNGRHRKEEFTTTELLQWIDDRLLANHANFPRAKLKAIQVRLERLQSLKKPIEMCCPCCRAKVGITPTTDGYLVGNLDKWNKK